MIIDRLKTQRATLSQHFPWPWPLRLADAAASRDPEELDRVIDAMALRGLIAPRHIAGHIAGAKP